MKPKTACEFYSPINGKGKHKPHCLALRQCYCAFEKGECPFYKPKKSQYNSKPTNT